MLGLLETSDACQTEAAGSGQVAHHALQRLLMALLWMCLLI